MGAVIDEPEVGEVTGEVVHLQATTPRRKPVWPDDDLTREWLAAIAAAREAANQPEPWADDEEPATRA